MADYFYVFASGDDETNETKKDDENDEQTEVSVVEQKDESEPASVTLEELANSDFIRNRQLAAKSIVEYLQQAGSNKEALHSVISVMCKLSEDEDIMVRTELTMHIPSIALFCKERSEDLGVVIRQQIVPYTVKLLTDNQRQVRKIGHSTLLVLLENNVVDNSQLSEWICPLIAQLAATSDNTSLELRIEDVSVMCKMIPYVGKEITEKFFLEPFLTICRNPSSVAREVCLLNFGNISKVIGREITETILLSAFLDLCQESWHVKLKCVDIAVDLASVVSPVTRNEILSHVFMTLLKNDSRAVSNAASHSLGRFISTFADPSKTGLNYSDGIWLDTPVEDEDPEEFEKNGNYFERLAYETIPHPHFLDECSFKNFNKSFDSAVFQDEMTQTLSSPKLNSSLKMDSFTFDTANVITFDSRVYCRDCRTFGATKYKQSQSQFKSDTTISEKTNDKISNFDVELFHVQNSSNCETEPLKNSTLTLLPNDDDTYLHIGNENIFNNFQFWRIPLPEVEFHIDVEETKSTNINLRTKLQNENESYSSATNFTEGIPLEQSTKKPSNILQNTDDNKLNKNEESDSSNLLLNNLRLQLKREWDKKVAVHENSLLEKDSEKIIKSRIVEKKTKENPTTDTEKIVHEQDIVPPELLIEFINIMSNDRADERESLVYYLPSVAYTLGRKYWPCIRDIFNSLAWDISYRIRKTIASSLHELAVILGPDITTEDLLPVFVNLLSDLNIRYTSSILMNISCFLKKLKPYARRQFLPLIEQICSWDEDDRNWRYRLTVAEQFLPCVELFTSDEALHFLPVSLLLLQDRVSVVRKSGVELLAVIIKSMVANLKSSEFLKKTLCALDEKYRKANKWSWRQLYVYICQELAVKKSLPTDFYVDEIIPSLFSLAWDTVPNVRLAVARCLGLTLLPLEFLPCIQKTHYQLLLQVMYSLQSDVDKDVRHFALLSSAAFNVLPPKKDSQGLQFKKCEEWWEKSNQI